MHMAFVCPECDRDYGLEEVMNGITQITEILDFDDGDPDYLSFDSVRSEPNYDDIHYRCRSCGYIIRVNRPACEPSELYDWLKERGMIVS